MAVKIIQLLCPARHCIFALAYEEEAMNDLEATDKAASEWTRLQSAGIDRWCKLCQSRKLTFEIGRTRFQSLVEAGPELARCQLEQLVTQAAVVRKQVGEN